MSHRLSGEEVRGEGGESEPPGSEGGLLDHLVEGPQVDGAGLEEKGRVEKAAIP